MVLFLAGGSGYTRRQGLRRVKERFENLPGASNVRYEPSAELDGEYVELTSFTQLKP